MKKIEDSCLKEIEFGVLRQFHDICVREGFHYSLIGGTLLGAIRHKGFIPWDDDIDVSMPRPDYNRFIKYCVDYDTPFTLLSHENNPCYKKLFSKIYDKRTVIVDEVGNRWNYDCGVHIDIFPIDAIGMSKKEAISAFKKNRFDFELLVASQWKRFTKSKTHSWYYEPFRFIFYVMSRLVNVDRLIEKIEKRITRYDFEQAKYVAAACGSYRFKEILPQSVYLEYESIEFEGEAFYAIKDHDAYLHSVYGDYMQLPPVERRVSHHTFEAFWRDGDND